MKHRMHRIGGLLVTAVLVAGACGDDDDDGGGGPETTTGEGGDATTTEDPGDGDSDGDTDGQDGDGDDAGGATTVALEEIAGVTPGGSLTVGLEAESDGLRAWEDPCAESCQNVRTTLYDAILARGEDGILRGVLAESFEANDDASEWTIVLRDGIEFHDGTPLTAQSIADMFPIQRDGTTTAGQVAEAGIVDVVADDELTVRYVLGEPNAGFPDSLQIAYLGAVFKADEVGDDNAASWNRTGPVTTGPYTLVSWDRDNELVVEKNPNYWRSDDDGYQLPYLDRITFRPMPDEGTRLDSLLAGDVDVILTLRESTVRDARAAGDDRVVTYERQGSQSGGSIFNTARPPVDDVRVRRGLIWAADSDVLIEITGGAGISERATQLYSPDSEWYSEEAAAAYPGYDPGRAAELLAEYVEDPDRSDGKAVGEPIEVEFNCLPDPSLLQVAQAVKEFWEATGLVQVDLNQVEQTVHVNNAIGADNNFEGTYMINCWRQGADTDPAVIIGNAFGPVESTAGNFTNYFDPDMHEKILEARRTVDFEERKAIYDEVLLQLAEDVPYSYTGHTVSAFAARPEVGGISGWTLPDGEPGKVVTNGINPWTQVHFRE